MTPDQPNPHTVPCPFTACGLPLNTIHQGDSIRLLPLLPSETIQAVIADPPYFQVLGEAWDNQWPGFSAYHEWMLQWLTQAMRVLRPDGLLFLFGQLGKREHGFLHIMSAATLRWPFHDLIIWDRAVGYNERRDSLTPAYELILVLRKTHKPKFRKNAVRTPYPPEKIATYMRDKRYKNPAARLAHLQAGKFATNILRVPSLKGSSQEKCGHPTQKPVALIEKLIAMSTDPGDIVLDPFLGSGTTAVAAQNLTRPWLGIEIHPPYAQLASARTSRPLQAHGS